MQNTARAVVHDGKIELVEPMDLPEGAQLIVKRVCEDEDRAFWLAASQSALDKIWNNTEDDVYEQLR